MSGYREKIKRLERCLEIEKMSKRLVGNNPVVSSDLVEKVVGEMCARYCKWPDKWDAEFMGYELCESEICASCPMNKL